MIDNTIGRRNAALVLGVIGAAIFIGGGLAQEVYPNKPVKIVVGMPAGSFTDLSARLIGDGLRQELNESFIVENRPGAATNIATQNVARSPKDGYTLLLSTNSNAMNVSLFKELPFDVVKDFQPIAMIASTAFILAVTPSLPVSNLKELIDHAKKHPDTLNFASTGSGTANHLAVEMLGKQADIKVTTVFYKGSMEGIADVLAGRTHAMFAPASSVIPQAQAGKLKAIAVTGGARTTLAPDVPTMAEAGLPGVEIGSWFALLAPAGTPKEAVARLDAEVKSALQAPDVAERLRGLGYESFYMPSDELGAFLKSDLEKWTKVIRAAGIRAD
jgi:tripartite-type tricarboxylate transporter receptor subunit TctC